MSKHPEHRTGTPTQRAFRSFRFVAAGCLLVAFALTGVRPSVAEACRAVTFEAEDFTVCEFDLRANELRLFWQDDEGRPYGAFSNLPREVDGAPLIFAMNAGMYDFSLAPIGLYVEHGRELRRVNTADGPGNFHLKPNGIFYVSGDRAAVMTTEHYIADSPSPDFATQSGPMLVIDRDIHPRFLPHSDSFKRRNGVGVRDSHTVVFAISEGQINFDHFARLFRDELDVADALFLDGTMSSLYAPALGREDARRPMGPIIGIMERPG